MLPKSRHCPLHLYQPEVPLQRVAIDILGPLSETERGNQYVLVIADYFTKWTEAFPMSYMEAHTVACVQLCHFKAPDYLHNDQGRNFESNLFSEICELLRALKARTKPYHTQSDRLVEQFNHTLLNMLSVATQDRERDWIYNYTPHNDGPPYKCIKVQEQLPSVSCLEGKHSFPLM